MRKIKKEKELIRLRLQGKSYKEIAFEMGTTEGTVKIWMHHIYKKLGVHGTAEFLAHPEIVNQR